MDQCIFRCISAVTIHCVHDTDLLASGTPISTPSSQPMPLVDRPLHVLVVEDTKVCWVLLIK